MHHTLDFRMLILDSAIQNNGFSRTDGYRGHGAGALKPAGRRLNSA